MRKILKDILVELSVISRTLDIIANVMLNKEKQERYKIEKSSNFNKLS
jgi:hypothetical protein